MHCCNIQQLLASSPIIVQRNENVLTRLTTLLNKAHQETPTVLFQKYIPQFDALLHVIVIVITTTNTLCMTLL